MKKQVLKIWFTDFWGGFNASDNLFVHMLQKHFELQFDVSKPDLLIYSCYTNQHLNYHCHKIFYTAENVRPDYKECDFAFSFDLEGPPGRHFRLPLYRWNGNLEHLTHAKDVAGILPRKKKFCCMLVSNGNCQVRNDFFHLLSQYKKVDSGGKFLNNVGGPVADKMQFIEDYKFVLSFENSSYPGYTTEKIIEPMFANSLPVYWGNPQVGSDFNTKSFVNVHDYKNLQEAADHIAYLDQDINAFANVFAQPFFNGNVFPESLKMEYIEQVLIDAVHQMLLTEPVAKKYRMYSQLKLQKQQLNRLVKRGVSTIKKITR